MEDAESGKDSVLLIYLSLMIGGILLGIVLQFMNLPFVFDFYKIVEKYLRIIGRLKNDDI